MCGCCSIAQATDYEGPADASKRSGRQLKWYMGRMERLVGDDGFAVGGKLSLADVQLYNMFADTLTVAEAANKELPAHRREPLASGARTAAALDAHPKLKACVASVAEHKNVQKWLAARGKHAYNF